MDLGILNKVALIGGASKGLGKACAISLAKEGVNLAICSNDNDSLVETTDYISSNFNVEVLPILVDLSQVKEIEKKVIGKVIDKFGRIDILVTNSGGPKPGAFFSLKEEDWRNAFDSVLLYVIELYRLVIPYMKENGWGRIINNTSLTVKQPAETMMLSNVFRTGVVSLAKTMSKDLIKSNITINNICPGAFKTDRAIELMQSKADSLGITVDQVEKEAVANLPMGRYQTPDEFGDLVAYLTSDLARSITGTTIQIDGGISNGLL
ncbi:MAG: SDR family oxidoreductase [Salinivirgaceae bacterium]|jgi:3-oxoacyl-[acyl-carrier protein] reductase|nr:SDR family oxidoreductase [Salinivirgaceae bacterium]